MQHHDDVGPVFERQRVTRLLVAAVATVGGMAMRQDAELRSNRDGRIVARVIDQQHFVDDVVRKGRVARGQRLFRVIRGHDDDDFFSVQHRPARMGAGNTPARPRSIARRGAEF